MANVDRPNGFRPVKTLSGSPVSGLIRSMPVGAQDIFVGDALQVSSGTAIPVTADGQTILGVAVGFGKKSDMEQLAGQAYHPSNLEQRWYDASAETEADWVVFYVPAEGVLFEAQFDSAPATLVVGQSHGLIYTTGDTSVPGGISRQEIDGADTTSSDFEIVEIPTIVDNDATAAFGRVYGVFTTTTHAQ